MPYKIKIDQNNKGSITFITSPSESNKSNIVLINLIEEYADFFAEKINHAFPESTLTVFLWERNNKDYTNKWLKRACDISNFIIVDKKNTTKELDELLDPIKTYVVTDEITLENILAKIQKKKFPN
jgi:hypothetical protein|tara:strand:+ start:458 stop:835 length:378 start_codon:yes stop_codon:yes gene_type:complete